MAAIGTIAAVVGTVASVAGTIVQGRAMKKAGEASRDAAYYEADQLERSAGEELAAAQREGFEIDRQTELLTSRQQAVAAASGAGAADASVLDAVADVQREGGYRRDLAIYGGIQRAKGLRAQAEATRRSGQASLQGSRMAAAGTIIGGIGSAASNLSSYYLRYGGGLQPVSGLGASGLRYNP